MIILQHFKPRLRLKNTIQHLSLSKLRPNTELLHTISFQKNTIHIQKI